MKCWRRSKNAKVKLFSSGKLLFLPFLLLTVALTAHIAAADFYKWVDEAGQTHYTDDPGQIPSGKRKKTETITTKENTPSAQTPANQSSHINTENPDQAGPPPPVGKGGAMPPPYRSSERSKYPGLIADGEMLPDAYFTGLDGSRLSVRSLRGKIALLNFWATWCGPCRGEMPSMQRLFTQLGGKKGFAMLSVSEETADKVKAFFEKLQYGFPVALAEKKQTSTRFGASSIPTTYILDRDGRVLFCNVGGIEWDDPKIAEWLRQLVETQ